MVASRRAARRLVFRISPQTNYPRKRTCASAPANGKASAAAAGFVCDAFRRSTLMCINYMCSIEYGGGDECFAVFACSLAVNGVRVMGMTPIVFCTSISSRICLLCAHLGWFEHRTDAVLPSPVARSLLCSDAPHASSIRAGFLCGCFKIYSHFVSSYSAKNSV